MHNKDIGWLIQRNFDDEPKATQSMVEWCEQNSITYELIDHIPFSNKFPETKIKYPIIYGNTAFIRNAIRDNKFLFYNRKNFRVSKGYEVCRDLFLNHRGQVIESKKLLDQWGEYTPMFVRPDDDLKSFSGQVFYSASELNNRFEQARSQGLLNNRTKVIVSPPLNIYREWRCVVVDGKVISISLYNTNNKLTVKYEDDASIWRWAQRMADVWVPSSVCTMDIGSTKAKRELPDNIYVSDPVECIGVMEYNCFHGAGWYANDIPTCMDAVTKAFIKNYSK